MRHPEQQARTAPAPARATRPGRRHGPAAPARRRWPPPARRSATGATRRSPRSPAMNTVSTAKPHRPDAALARQRERSLDDQRVAEQADEAAEVAGRIEEVRITSRRARVPALQQRGGARDREERQPDRRSPVSRAATRWARPDCGIAAAGATIGNTGDDGEQEEHVHDGLRPLREPGRGDVDVEVAEEQGELEEQQAGRPGRRGAAHHRQHHAGEHRLDDEEQRRREEDGDREQRQRRPGLVGRGARLGNHRRARRRAGAATAPALAATSSRTS